MWCPNGWNLARVYKENDLQIDTQHPRYPSHLTRGPNFTVCGLHDCKAKHNCTQYDNVHKVNRSHNLEKVTYVRVSIHGSKQGHFAKAHCCSNVLRRAW